MAPVHQGAITPGKEFVMVDDQYSLDRYFEEIGNEELLTPEKEIELSRRVKNGEEDALEQITCANLRFVVTIAKRYQNQGLSLGDLINEGNLGLIKAAKRFDETRGFKFISYAVWWIRQSILQALAEQSRVVRLPLNKVGQLNKVSRTLSDLEQAFEREPTHEEVAESLNITAAEVSDSIRIAARHVSVDAPFAGTADNNLLDVLTDDDDGTEPDFPLIEESLKIEVERALGYLTSREAEILKLYFGLNTERSMTLEEIGRRFKLTRERVRQIKEKSIKKLRHASRSNDLRAFLG